jgi:hypothetical protein
MESSNGGPLPRVLVVDDRPATLLAIETELQLPLLHGGTVEARTAGPGLGSEFVVRLPLSVASEKAVDAECGGIPPDRRAARCAIARASPSHSGT